MTQEPQASSRVDRGVLRLQPVSRNVSLTVQTTIVKDLKILEA